ncbi:hypothetical protein HPB50_029359 [Hyalomma asiaticum]|nr:hypothetical protein HPB50_029359 [Hyalomma asiaticum]
MFSRVIQRCNIKRAFILGKRRSGFDSVHEFCGDDEVLYEYEGLDSSGASFVEWTTGTTGDLGYYDHYGRLFLCGRLKTMLVCQTRKVAPVEIEHCLLEHAAVEEVAVLGVPAPDGEEFPAAVVVTKRGRSQDQELANDLKSFVAERTPSSFMHLHGGVYFADALRKNTRGKSGSPHFESCLEH